MEVKELTGISLDSSSLWENIPNDTEVLLLATNTHINSPRGNILPSSLKAVFLELTENDSIEGITLPPLLQILKINGIHITSLGGIILPPSLKELDLSDTHIKSLDGITLPSSLKELDLYKTEIESLEGITLPPSLEKLDLSETKIKSLEGTTLPDSLKELDLSLTEIDSLEGIVLPDSLEILNLNNTKIESLEGIKLPDSLKELYLYSVKIESLEGIKLPDSLKELMLYKTKIDSLIGIKLPDSLEILNLSNTKIESLEGIKLPDSLKELGLSLTKIESLEGIKLPDSLEELNIAYTKITTLNNVTIPSNLKRLILWLLVLDEMPMQIAQKRITYINDFLPPSENYDGEYILIGGLKLRNQPIDLLRQNNHDLILDWYHQEKEIVNKAKIIFLGDGEAGKTYLIRRITNDGRKESDSVEDKQFFATTRTHGILIKKMDSKLSNKKEMHLSFWDFGGQHIMHSMHKVFLTQDTCYVIMVKTGTERQMDQARSWLRTVESVAPNAPIILLINQVDRTGETIDEQSLHEEFKDLHFQIVRFNAKSADEKTIKEFEKILVEKVSTLECCTAEIPKSWESIRKEIIDRSRESLFIHQDDYYEICTRYALPEEHQIPLLNRFNTLGSCFSYHKDRDDKVFLEYKILNPEWFTNAAYLIITKGQEFAVNKQGVLTQGEIKSILKHPEDGVSGELPFLEGVKYEPEHCEYILDIMHQHQLSYRTEDGNEFVPALCTPNKPVDVIPTKYKNSSSKKEICYKLKFHYLPETVIHRLMILWYGILKKDKCWYSGMRIDFKGKDYSIIVNGTSEPDTLSINVLTWGNANSNEFFASFIESVRQICKDVGIKMPEDYISRFGADLRVDDIVYKAARNKKELDFGREEVEIIPLLNEYFMPKAFDCAIKEYRKDLSKSYPTNYFAERITFNSCNERPELFEYKSETVIDQPQKVVIKEPHEVIFDDSKLKDLFSQLKDHCSTVSDETVHKISEQLGTMIAEVYTSSVADHDSIDEKLVDIKKSIEQISDDLKNQATPPESRLHKFLNDSAICATLIGFFQANPTLLPAFIDFMNRLFSSGLPS